MRLIIPVLLVIMLTGTASAVTRVDPILGDSPVAQTSAEEKTKAMRIDPVIGDSPVANTGQDEREKHTITPKEKQHHPKHHDKVKVINNYYYATPYAQPHARQEITTYGVSDIGQQDSNITLDGQSITLINRWKGKCNRKHCMASAGYLTATPGKGVLVLMNPALSNGPELFFPPEDTGPLRIFQDDSLNFRLIVESVSGNYETGKERFTTAGGKRYFFHIMNGGWEF